MQLSESNSDAGHGMNRKLRVPISCSQGAGSILDIAPSSNWGRFVPQESFNERLQADFLRVGGALRYGIDTFKEETSSDGTPKSFLAAG